MKKLLLLIVLSLLMTGMAWGQTMFFNETMGTVSGTTTIAAHETANGFSETAATYSGTADLRVTTVSSGYTGASGSANVFFTNTAGRLLLIEGINTAAHTNITMTLGHYKNTTTGSNELTIEVSSDGTNWSPLSYTRPSGASWALISPSGTIPATSNLRIRFTQTSTATQFRIDDIKLYSVSGTPTPTITVNPSTLSGFTYVFGAGPSTTQTFTVSGADLTANVSIAAPANYEISLSSGSGYATPLTINHSGGSVAETTIYVRLKPGLAVGNYNSETINITSTDATAQTVTCSGSVTDPLPQDGYLVNFEGATETKTAYASGTVNLGGIDWNMTEALIGTDAADWKNGLRSARMRGYAASAITMLADKTTGLGTLSFQYRRYGTDPQVDWKVEYSTNGGGSWTQIGDSFTAPASTDVQTFTAAVNVAGNVRIRIIRATETGGSNARLNIDDISLTDYVSGGNPPPIISNIIHSPSVDIMSTTPVSVSANVTDDSAVNLVQLKWGTATGTYPNTINMALSTGSTYVTATNIPAQVDGTTVYYVVYAEDDDSEPSTSTERSYLVRDPATTTLPYTQDFSAGWDDVYTTTVSGTRPWYIYNNDNASCNGHLETLEEHWLVLPAINFNNYANERMTFNTIATYGVIDANNYLKLMYSPNYFGMGDPTTATWTEILFTNGGVGGGETPSGVLDLTGINGTNVYLAFKYYSTNNATRWEIDDISIYAGATPAITVSTPSLSGFTYALGSGPSAEQSFTVSGADLERNLSIYSPANFEASTESDGEFTVDVIRLTPVDGVVANTPIYIRLVSGLAIDSYSGNVSISSNPATTKEVALSGSVTTPPPPNAPVATDATNITSSSFSANWGAVSGATSYRLDVYTEPTRTELINMDFEGYTNDTPPPGWTRSSSGSYFQNISANAYSGTHYAGTNATNGWVQTPQITNPGTLTYWAKASGTTSNYTIKVQSSTNGSDWTDQQTIVADGSNTGSVTTTYTQKTVNLNLVGDFYLRWFMSARTGGSLYFDDVVVTGGSTSYVEGYEDLNVGNVVTYPVSGLNPGTTYYYVVRSVNEYGTSDNSNTITATTLASDPFGGYYNPVAGLSGSALKSGLRDLLPTNTNTNYDGAKLVLFQDMDNVGGVVKCVYTGETWTVNSLYNGSTNPNTEHTYAQSWFDGTASESVKKADLHHLFITNSSVNSSRSNYPFDEVTNVSATFSVDPQYVSKRGTNADGRTVWEPADPHKGNLARAMLYFHVRYDMPLSWNGVDMLETMLDWNTADPVDVDELARNAEAYTYQGNRNFFIDKPQYITSIWGGAPANTVVQFNPASAMVNEGDGTVSLSVEILNPSATNATTAQVVLTSGDAADTGNYTTTNLTFPANTSTPQEVVITITDDTLLEGTETLIFTLSNVSGGDSAIAGFYGSFSLAILDNDIPVPVATDATLTTMEGFTANWNATQGITDFEFDLSTSNTFATFVPGYEALMVTGTSLPITGLNAGTTYFYRLRAVYNESAGANSNVIEANTKAPTSYVELNALAPVTENFNYLTSGDWVNGITAPGWYAKTDATPTISTYAANTGTTTTGALYAFGVEGTNPLSDRALGLISSNSFTGASGTGKGYIGWRLKNNTGSTVNSLTVTWTGEQWRKENNAAAHTLNLYYQTGETVTDPTSGTWTSASSVFTSPITGATTATALDGNAPANRVADIVAVLSDLNLADGQEIMLRWEDLNDAGSDHAMAIDDLSVEIGSATLPPAVTVSTEALTGFTYVAGSGPSDEQSFTVSGSNLEGDITVTPPTNYEISTVSGGSFLPTNPITLSPTEGTVGNTTIYVRLKANLSAGDYNSEQIVIATTGVTPNKTVTCSGSVTEPVVTPNLFISEYIEGSVGNNKAIEIFNASGDTVDMTQLNVKVAANGGAWGTAINLTGSLANHSVYVLANTTADAAILAVANQTSSSLSHNGDDAIGLFYGTTLIDIIGVQGVDPGDGWAVAGVANGTKDHTLIRKPTVTQGNLNWAVSAGTDADDSEWIVQASEYFANIGLHTYGEAPDYTASPVFDPMGGTFTTAINVSLSCSTENSTIRYTVDGSTPTTETGTVYENAIPVVATTMIKAIAYADGYEPSAVVSQTYTINIPAEYAGIHYWNFNENVPASSTNWTQPINATYGSGVLTYSFTQAYSYTGTTINGVDGEVAGGCFVPRGGVGNINNGEYFLLDIPTTGYEDIVITYVTQRTSTGFTNQQVIYSLDGGETNVELTNVSTIPSSWGAVTLDFSDIPGADNNPNFMVGFILSGATNTDGNNRIDNIQVTGTQIAGGDLDTPELSIAMVGEQIQLSWTAVDGAVSYQVLHCDTPDGEFTQAAVVNAPTTTWNIPSVVTKKFYQVIARDF